ncbi:MAG: DUF4097 family beta strand repeat protein [Candidatus Eremiobacteraeota bacterium]|nr:DUF4097 family beta strand repeat protein [Candidatus Eremiobacteraeota bacterium]
MAARGRLFAALAFPVLGACSGSFGERVHENVHRTIAAGSAPVVRVENVAGTVRVEGLSRATVDVQATKYGYDAAQLRSVGIDVSPEDGGVSIVTRYGNDSHGGGVRYRIEVPIDASLRIGNIAGAVELAGVRGNIEIETQAGEITADAGVVSGTRSIDLRATTGAVNLTIARGSSARVEAYSTVGDFNTDVPGLAQQREHIVGARGGGTIGSGSAHIRLSTTTGAIALKQR